MEFRAPHGCYELERRVGGNFTVDVAFDADADLAAAADDVSLTVNYVDIYETVRAQMALPSNIIENVALRIVDALRARFPQITRVEVTVSKLAPPIGGKSARVSVTLTK